MCSTTNAELSLSINECGVSLHSFRFSLVFSQ